MNILMLAPDFIPSQGGVGVYISELIQHFSSDVNIHVLAPRRVMDNSIFAEKNIFSESNFPKNVTVHYLGEAKDTFLYNFSFQIRCFLKISEYILKYKIDLIHSQSAMPDLFINPKKVSVPIISTVHSTIHDQINAIIQSKNNFFELDYSEKFTRFFGSCLLPLEEHYYSSNRNFIAVSNWTKSNLINKYDVNPSHIRVIHNGVDSNKFKKIDFSVIFKHFPQLCDLSGIKVLYLSRLVKSKGIQDLMNAIPLINEDLNVNYIIAGPGKPIPVSSAKIIQLGYVPHHLTHYLYSFVDIFVLPSMSENFPISVLEAMSSKNAIITTNVGGIPEIITNNYNGILIHKNCPNEIAEKITYLILNEKIRSEMGLNARNTIISNYSWQSIAQMTQKYYEEVINNANCSY